MGQLLVRQPCKHCLLSLSFGSLGLVVTKLGLTKMSKASQEILDRAIGRIEERTSAMVASLRHEDYFQGCDFQRVSKTRICESVLVSSTMAFPGGEIRSGDYGIAGKRKAAFGEENRRCTF